MPDESYLINQETFPPPQQVFESEMNSCWAACLASLRNTLDPTASWTVPRVKEEFKAKNATYVTANGALTPTGRIYLKKSEGFLVKTIKAMNFRPKLIADLLFQHKYLVMEFFYWLEPEKLMAHFVIVSSSAGYHPKQHDDDAVGMMDPTKATRRIVEYREIIKGLTETEINDPDHPGAKRHPDDIVFYLKPAPKP